MDPPKEKYQNGKNKNIIEINHFVQYQTNRMGRCRDISQKPDFGPNLGLNGPNFGPKIFGQHKKPPLVVKYH